MIEIKPHHLKRWKANSIEVARKLGYDESLLEFLDEHVKLKINYSKIQKGMWYGFADYDEKCPVVEVYSKNLSCESIHLIFKELRNKGVPGVFALVVAFLLVIAPRETFFNIYNQSGMDHELIGHIYNWLSQKNHDEKAAVKTELDFIKARRGWFPHKCPWNVFSIFAPKILYYHKKVKF
ncbi:hypothetical protein KAW48_10430 [candidate division WOR-3 bacterium]|nr:hypothetical protein [candidate division WOR-3 bacterium]